ncbi:MAG: RagB/SusD family nutrient uptake outer membrane protein [Chitinophagaceae bacterium]
MKMIHIKNSLLLAVMALAFNSCKKDFGNLNNPTVEDFLANASQSQLNNLVSGTESGMRTSMAFYIDDVGTIGREGYRFSGSEPRYVTDLLGFNSGTLSNSNFYIATPWSARYRVIKNCNVLIEAATNSTLITEPQRKAYTGFAKTIKAYQLLLNLNLTYTNGVRVDVNDPDNLGPVLNYDQSLTAIITLLNSGKTDLTGSAVSFPLAGFAGLSDAAGLVKFNRALAARVAVYQEDWDAAQTALDESFLDPAGDFNAGVYHTFGTGSGDQLNPMFIPQNTNGETRVAHPSFATDINPGDDRINKATLRNTTASLSGLSSDRDVWVYKSSTAPIALIRNEELILLSAEVSLQNGALPAATTALNIIRGGHGLSPYSGASTEDALLTELLTQRRYSLFYEGHRWIDLRRYNRLDELPIDRGGDDVWVLFPLPLTEE